MSYDNWKLSNPQDEGWYSDLVTSCCGAEEEIKENLCDDSKIFYCSECGETNGFYNMVELYEYEEIQRDNANEFNRDDL